jgi:hypothetical protein
VVCTSGLVSDCHHGDFVFCCSPDASGKGTAGDGKAVCRYAEVPEKDDIFADAAAFDLGFARLIQESYEAGHNLVQRKQLNIVVQGIRSKLGLQKRLSCTVRDSKSLSSRQIPPNSGILVELVSGTKVLHFGATVTHNDTYELVLSPTMAIEAVPGQMANIQYHLGTMVWVFETVVISCGPQGLELNHSDRVKFINRRRFSRISVQKKAMIAVFHVNPAGDARLKPPVFVDAMVTEISGPGLRIQTDLDLKTQDRILVVFEVESGRFVQDVAEVQGVRDSAEGRSVGVEMIGLSERSLNDLLRIVNSLAGAEAHASFPEGAEEHSATPETQEQMV